MSRRPAVAPTGRQPPQGQFDISLNPRKPAAASNNPRSTFDKAYSHNASQSSQPRVPAFIQRTDFIQSGHSCDPISSHGTHVSPPGPPSDSHLSPGTYLTPNTQPYDPRLTARAAKKAPLTASSRPSGCSRETSQSWLLPKKDVGSSSQASPKKKWSCKQMVWLFARTFRFHGIYSLLSKQIGLSNEEEKKVAIYKSKTQALVQCTIHVLPVFGAITLVTLNIKQYYVGGTLQGAIGEDSSKLGALQFAAKLHELLMLASLGVVVFTAIRRELALGSGLPFGAVLVGLQIDSISTLWSMEFWSIVIHAWNGAKIGRTRRWLLVGLILCCTVLGVSVGPSTANLMRPRMAWWPAGGTTYWISATPNEIFPETLDFTPELENCDTSDNTICPSADYAVIGESWLSMWKYLENLDVMPPSFYLPGLRAERQTVMGARAADGEFYLLPNAYTWATVSPAVVANGLAYLQALWIEAVNSQPEKHYNWLVDAQFAVETFQPYAFVFCASWYMQYPSIANALPFPDWSQMGYSAEGFNAPTVEVTNSTTISIAQQFLSASNSTPGLLWLDDPSLRDATGSTVNAVTRLPAGLQSQSSYCTCSAITGYAPITIQGTRDNLKFVTGYPHGMQAFRSPSGIPNNESWTRVVPSAKWLEYVNPELKQRNTSGAASTSPYVELVRAGGLWNSTRYASEFNSGPITESILASMLVNGIARTPRNASLIGTLRENWPYLYLPRRPLGQGKDIYELLESEKERSTSFDLTVQIEGYAYSYKGVTQMAAIITLLIYCLLACMHTVYAVWPGWCSGCWDSAPEITVLALTSDAAQEMKNTGAGIQTMETYAQGIQIREKEGRLQIVSTPDYGSPRNIIAGVKYG